jgi:hypothetical protein
MRRLFWLCRWLCLWLWVWCGCGCGLVSVKVFAIANGPEAAVGFLALSLRCTLAPLNIKLSAVRTFPPRFLKRDFTCPPKCTALLPAWTIVNQGY